MALSGMVCVIQKNVPRANLDSTNARADLDATKAKKRKLEWEEEREVDVRVG